MNESIIGERFGRLVVVGYHHSNKYKSTWRVTAWMPLPDPYNKGE